MSLSQLIYVLLEIFLERMVFTQRPFIWTNQREILLLSMSKVGLISITGINYDIENIVNIQCREVVYYALQIEQQWKK